MFFIDLDTLKLTPQASSLYFRKVTHFVVLVVRRTGMAQLVRRDSVREFEFSSRILEPECQIAVTEFANRA